MCEPVIKIDTIANAAYIALNKRSIHETIQITETIFLDVDFNSYLIGIEYLSLDEKFPLDSQLLQGIEISPDCQLAIRTFENSR
jgi:uncharacterized protein YuzE